MRSLFFNFSHPLVFLFFVISISAQPVANLGTITNNGDGMFVPYEFCLGDNDNLIARTNIVLGGLQIMGTYPNQYGVIPSYAPDMFIEYTIDGIVYPPVAMGHFSLLELGNGFPAFSYIAPSPAVNFSEKCRHTTQEEPFVFATVRYRLVTPDGSGWDVYPACDYDQDYGMFSCYVYSYAPWCEATTGTGFAGPTDPTPTCYDEWFSGGYLAKMRCECGDSPGPTHDDEHVSTGDGFSNNNEEINNRFIKDRKVNVYPNPIDDMLHIESSNEVIRTVEIYNSRGDLVIRKKYEMDKIQNISLNTTDFPHGLYLARITTNAGIEVIKVLK